MDKVITFLKTIIDKAYSFLNGLFDKNLWWLVLIILLAAAILVLIGIILIFKKTWKVLLVLVILGGVGFLVYYFMFGPGKGTIGGGATSTEEVTTVAPSEAIRLALSFLKIMI